jgi:membrane-bound lytic murein transglycosylase D
VWRYHRVAPDDTLEAVARTYHVSVSDLADANQLEPGQNLSGVEALVVPVPPAAAPSAHTVMYTARRGDTLVSIADRFGVSLDQLRRWNKLPPGTRVNGGQRLHVVEPVTVRGSRGRRHRTTITDADLHPKAAKHESGKNSREAGDPPARKKGEHGASTQESTKTSRAKSAESKRRAHDKSSSEKQK